eukprot:GDKH01021342.1.p2 GENE.GDKH01021342.1~~GDKH01021342.1.p2  ORF type:complete len:79 (+),score=5.15 GDKH01021342.1:595-831(+)
MPPLSSSVTAKNRTIDTMNAIFFLGSLLASFEAFFLFENNVSSIRKLANKLVDIPPFEPVNSRLVNIKNKLEINMVTK